MNSSQTASNDARRRGGAAGQSAVPPVAIVLLALIAILIGATLYLFLELNNTRTEMAEKFAIYEEQIAQLEGSVNRTSRAVDTSVQEVKGLVQSAEKEITQKASQAAASAIGRTETLKKELEQTRQQQQAALSEVGGRIQSLASETDDKVGALSGRVEGVSETLSETRQELQQAVADLKSVRGDLGVQSGLIATNADELDALRRLGERNYYEFDIDEKKEWTRVGRIQIRLRDTNDGKGNYTIDVMADDKVIRKKNKGLLEPVQFYVIGSKIPYEIVVNRLEKNHIVGYLATPLDSEPRGSSSGD